MSVTAPPPDKGPQPKLYAGVLLYNEIWSLGRCLDSLASFDQVIVADGRFPHADGHELSTDGSREIALQYPNVKLINAPNQFISAKQNLIHSLIDSPDSVLVYVDPDCHIVGNVKGLRRVYKGTAEIPVYMKSWRRHPGRTGVVEWRAWVLNPYRTYVAPWSHGTFMRHRKIIHPTERLTDVAIIHDDAGRPDMQQEISNTIHAWYNDIERHDRPSLVTRGIGKLKRFHMDHRTTKPTPDQIEAMGHSHP